MAFTLPRRAKLFEFFTLAAVIGVLALVLLDRMAALEAQAERMVVEATVRNINSGLRLEKARWMAGSASPADHWMAESPVRFLKNAPPGYIGSVASMDGVPEGAWAWLAGERQLVYRARQAVAAEHPSGVWRFGWRIGGVGLGNNAGQWWGMWLVQVAD